MNRRNALKLFGAFIACMTGTPIAMASEEFTSEDNSIIAKNIFKQEPMDYMFDEKLVNNIIIRTKEGEELKIPFSEIVEALRE